jgi:hypothetical protein
MVGRVVGIAAPLNGDGLCAIWLRRFFIGCC